MARIEPDPGNMQDKHKFNMEVIRWYNQTLNLIKARVARMGIEGKKELLSSVQSPKARAVLLGRIKNEGLIKTDLDFVPLIGRRREIITEFGKIVGVRFDFPIHGVYLQKGAGPGSRKKRNWFNAIMNKQVPLLADIQAKYGADQVVKATKFKIK